MVRFRLGEVRVDRKALRRLFDAGRGTKMGDDLDRRAARVRSRARQLVGVDTGLLISTIRVESGPGYRDVVAGRRGAGTKYVLPHHDGSEPHVIRPRRAKALRFVINGRVIFAARVNHPGSRGTYFLTRALPAARD
jgi:hypothetical protein